MALYTCTVIDRIHLRLRVVWARDREGPGSQDQAQASVSRDRGGIPATSAVRINVITVTLSSIIKIVSASYRLNQES